ncbi:MAG: ABC transporter ATP-binding protein [Acidobacteriota bacterium]
MSETTLIARDLKKVIGKKTIVESISFQLNAGEVFGFLGPNGAGKTTTIRMLVGLIRPTEGSVEICGHDIQRDLEGALQCVGCIVETPDLYRFMTGRENLEHFARMLGNIRRDQIANVADLVKLSHRLDDKVRTYSLGMRQRLGIAQALLGNPRVLILDEPANGLDPAGIREMRELLRSLAHERQLSIFVSSHLLAEIELMCDRVAIIHRGKILRTGRVAELIDSTREVEFKVDSPAAASNVAARLGYSPVVSDHTFRLAVDDAGAATLVEALTREGISVYRVQPRQQTLEEMFMEATGGESVAG